MEQTVIIEEVRSHLSDEKVKKAIELHSYIRGYLGGFFRGRGFIEVPPVIISPVTDPLNHPVLDPHIDYYGTQYGLTKSMIFHKQILVKELGSIFTFSPNVRLETPDKAETGRHLSEFTQIDVEKVGASREQMMDLVEDLYIGLLKDLSSGKVESFNYFDRKLIIPEKPFKRIKYKEAEKEYGNDFESILSSRMKEPFWIIDIPLDKREFYDREYEDQNGILRDMDLIYPEGFGEALSGGEREFKIDRIIKRIHDKNQTEEQFKWFIEYAKHGLEPSAGFGIGIERLTRFVSGLKRIEDTHPFPKIPGKISL